MKCPSCSREANENNKYCDFCGASLFGPRSIDLSTSNIGTNNVGQFHSNNIKSITGIDINEIAPVRPVVEDKKDYSPKRPRNKKKNKSDSNVLVILLIIAVVVLTILCIVLFIVNLKGNDNKSSGKQNFNIEGIYGVSSNYMFYLPDEYLYHSSSNELIIYNDKVSINLYNSRKGQIDKITAQAMKKNYKDLGYDVEVEEKVLSQKKIMYVIYTHEGVNFIDFYYQYDSEKIIFGQIGSKEKDLLNDDVRSIISSIKIRNANDKPENYNAPINFNHILSGLN